MEKSATPAITEAASRLILEKWIKEMPYYKVMDSNQIITNSMPEEGIRKDKPLHVITMGVGTVIPSSLDWFIYWAYQSNNNYIFIFPMEDMDIMFSVINGLWGNKKITLAIENEKGDMEQLYVPESHVRYGYGYYEDLANYLNKNIKQAKFRDGTAFSIIKIYFNNEEVAKTIVNLIKDSESINNISRQLSKVADIFSDKLEYEVLKTDTDRSYANKTIKLPLIVTNSATTYKNTIKLSGKLNYKQIGRIITAGDENPIKVKDILSSIFMLKTYVAYPTGIKIKYEIDNEFLIITIDFTLELVTVEDYYNTIGYYETRIKNICMKKSRYMRNEIQQVSEDLGLDVTGLTDNEICEKFRHSMFNVSFKDFELAK
jgi:hypothetical protein